MVFQPGSCTLLPHLRMGSPICLPYTLDVIAVEVTGITMLMKLCYLHLLCYCVPEAQVAGSPQCSGERLLVHAICQGVYYLCGLVEIA